MDGPRAAAGALLNRWCDALLLMVIAAATPRAPTDLMSSLDRLRRPEARRPKALSRAAVKLPPPRKPV